MTNLNEQNPMQYLVLVNGKTLSTYPSRTLAEAAVMNLDEGSKSSASIVPVTGSGKQMLFG